MNIEKLKLEYLKLTSICAETNFSDKNSVRKNNIAVQKMYGIMTELSESNDQNEILIFSKLLGVKENRTNSWIAIQLLEKLKVDKNTEKQCLEVIESVISENTRDAIGFKIWLDEYNSKIGK